MRGAPEWLAEILSASTASYDQSIKIPIYERCGVPEAWLVEPVREEVTIYRLDAGRYKTPVILPLKGRTTIRTIPGVSIDWDRMLTSLSGI